MLFIKTIIVLIQSYKWYNLIVFCFNFVQSSCTCTCVVYFDQQMGALHPVCWSKSVVSALKCNFPSLTEEKERKAPWENVIFLLFHLKSVKLMKFNGGFTILFLSFFYICDGKNTKKTCLLQNNLFQPANGMRSTHLLVEIHNNTHVKKYFSSKAWLLSL